jgi:hypothetical protein
MLYKLRASIVASASSLIWLAVAFGLEIGIGRMIIHVDLVGLQRTR